MGIVQGSDPDPFVYARGRLCIEATAAGVQPIAVTDPMGLGVENLGHEDLVQTATDIRNLGFKGMVCSHPVWVAPINQAYTPSESLVDYYTQVREVFAQALAAGTAAAPFAGRMPKRRPPVKGRKLGRRRTAPATNSPLAARSS